MILLMLVHVKSQVQLTINVNNPLEVHLFDLLGINTTIPRICATSAGLSPTATAVIVIPWLSVKKKSHFSLFIKILTDT